MALIPAPHSVVEQGSYDRTSWRYRLNLPGPSVNTDLLAEGDAVLHVQWRPVYAEPWRSENPFDTAAGVAALRYEQRPRRGWRGSYTDVPQRTAKRGESSTRSGGVA